MEELTNNLLFRAMAFFVVISILGAIGALARDAMRKGGGVSMLTTAGLFLVFIGERLDMEGLVRIALSGGGVLIIGAGLVVGVRAMLAAKDARRDGLRLSLIWNAVAVGGLCLYGLTLPSITDALSLDEEALARWNGSLAALAPLTVLIGLLPAAFVDRILLVHPRALPANVAKRAATSGLIAALTAGLLIPVNFLASSHDKVWDVAYFRTTRAGESTQNLARTVASPVSVTLFYPSGNDTRAELEPYFNTLVEASEGNLTLTVADQANRPKLAEQLGIRENGYVTLTMGDNTEKFKVSTEMKKAKKSLKELDSTVRKHLIKLTRGPRTVYWMVGHGEASAREKKDQMRKLNRLKREVFEPANLKLTDFGVSTGSTDAVPDDAALLVIAAPMKPLLPEEVTVVNNYVDAGGALLVMAEVDGDNLTEVFDHLGVQLGTGILAHETKHLSRYGGKVDRILLATNKFGSHESVKTLARMATQRGVIIPTARWVAKKPSGDTKVTTLIRAFPETWADLDRNLEHDPTEERKAYELAVAVTKPDSDLRAIVVGDVNLMSDALLSASQGNEDFARDGLMWLLEDEAIAGEINNEHDVEIVHTRDEDFVWFWLTVAAVPLGMLGLGITLIRLRRRS
ncbi:MAG: hypothetical protein GWP91_01015 [Rhodobacterales bacterium]|nr:hypothetical protein [Rhodobacterales bacterium]